MNDLAFRDRLQKFAKKARNGGLLLLSVAKSVASAGGSGVVWAGRGCHRFVHQFEPWGIVLTVIGLVIALITIVIDLEDRQSERTFRAWQVVRELESRNVELDGHHAVGMAGSAMRKALEYLNQEYDGFVCMPGFGWVSKLLTGNDSRECLIPKKDKEFMTGLKARYADLAFADLAEASLATSDLYEANLSKANLCGADLFQANLTGANLTGTNLTGAFLMDANLTRAIFTDAVLTRANFAQANLAHAMLMEANLAQANLASVNLTGAFLVEANLAQANLADANLTGAFLTSVVLTGTKLMDANLTHVGLAYANLTDANLADANLTGAFLVEANLADADLADADLSATNLLRTVNLGQSQLSAACGVVAPRNLPAGLTWQARQCP